MGEIERIATRPAPVSGGPEGPVPTKGAGRVVVRPCGGQDLEQVHHLYLEVFGESWARRFQARWQWAQEENLYPDQTFRWALLDRDQVVGFLATVPLAYTIGGTPLVAHTPCDYMVHPRYRFHGIKLMQEFFRTCPNCVTCDDIPASMKVATWLGAKRIGDLTRYVNIVDGRALRSKMGWQRTPGPLWWAVTQALAAQGRLREARLRPKLPVTPAYHLDQRFHRVNERLSRLAPAMLSRDLRFLRWRYGPESPHSNHQIGVIADAAGELRGYVIFYFSPSSQAGTILDLQVLPPGDPEGTLALVTYAVTRLRRQGAWLVRCHVLSSPFNPPTEVLRRCGFVPRGRHQVLVKFQDERTAAIGDRAENWNYSYGDSEASHSWV